MTIDSYSTHELVDRSYSVMVMLHELLEAHQHAHLLEKEIKSAHRALYKLYQAAGALADLENKEPLTMITMEGGCVLATASQGDADAFIFDFDNWREDPDTRDQQTPPEKFHALAHKLGVPTRVKP